MENTHIDRRSKYSQKMIRSAMLALLEEKELNEITVTDICRIADVNRGTFYKYYRDVEDLLYQIEEAFTVEVIRLFQDAEPEDFVQEMSDYKNMKLVVEQAIVMISENRDLVRIAQKGKTASRMIKNILAFVKPYMVQIIRENYRDITEEETTYICEYVLGGITNMVVKWIEEDMKVSLPRMQKMLLRMLTCSLIISSD